MSSEDKCEKALYMRTEYVDLRPETNNWKYGEKDRSQPAASKYLVILYELQIPDGVSSEYVYHLIEKQGREVTLNKSYYGQQYGGGVFNCLTRLYLMLDMPAAAV
ncbi:hypothetical protein DL767_004530 [Monosporascus sp. MG133]|nr:hypothetical protein DL767_004530 [Monosporascus sp. MG133]